MRTRSSDARRRLQAMSDNALIQGPGTGTSDSIPARLSDGEFVLPADTVRKVGVKSLRDLVKQTHEPSGRPYHPARFADGGLAEDDQIRQRAGSDLVSQIPTEGYPDAPKADGSLSGWQSTEVGRNLNNAAAALPGVASAVPAVVKTGGAISAGLNAASKLLNAGAAAGGASAIPTPTASSAPAPLSPNPTDERLAAGVQQSPVDSAAGAAVSPAKTAAALSNDITKTVDANGRTSYSGTNVGPGATIEGQKPGGNFVGGSTDAASGSASLADRLASLNREANIWRDISQSQGSQGVPTPQVLHSGNSWQARTDLRNAQTGASTLRGEWDNFRDGVVDRDGRPTGARGTSAAAAAFQSLLEADQTARGQSSKMPGEAMRASAELGIEGSRQQGASARAALTAAGDAGRQQLDRDRLGMEQTAAQFQNRSAQRLENAQLALEGAKTPEELRTARERLMALAGKKDDDVWAHSPGGQVVDPKTQQLVTQPGTIYNRRTGETRADSAEIEQPAAPPPKKSLVVGQTYQTPRGKAVWDGKQFKAV